MTRISCALIAAALLMSASARPAAAIKQFQDEWMKLYVEGNDNEDFVEAAKEAKCYICHQGKKKSNHNPYGEHLEHKLSKKDKKDVEKIIKEIQAAGELESDGEGSPTYAELIAEGKLPGGTLEEAKEEPKKD